MSRQLSILLFFVSLALGAEPKHGRLSVREAFEQKAWCPTAYHLVKAEGDAAVPRIVAYLQENAGRDETAARTRCGVLTGALWYGGKFLSEDAILAVVVVARGDDSPWVRIRAESCWAKHRTDVQKRQSERK